MLFTTVLTTLSLAASALSQVTFQNSSQTRLRVDNGTYGPEIEEVHYCMLAMLPYDDSNADLPQTTTNGPSASQWPLMAASS